MIDGSEFDIDPKGREEEKSGPENAGEGEQLGIRRAEEGKVQTTPFLKVGWIPSSLFRVGFLVSLFEAALEHFHYVLRWRRGSSAATSIVVGWGAISSAADVCS